MVNAPWPRGGHRLLLRPLREDHELRLRALVADHARAGDGLLVQPRVPARRRPRRAQRATGRSSCGTTGWSAAGAGATAGTASNCTSPVFGVGLAVQPLEGQERLSPVLTTGHEILTDSGGPGRYRGGCGVEKGGDADAGRAHRHVLLLRPRALDHLGHRGRPAVDPARRVAEPGHRRRALPRRDLLQRADPGGRLLHAAVRRRRRLRRPARARPGRRAARTSSTATSRIDRARKDYGVVVDGVDAELAAVRGRRRGDRAGARADPRRARGLAARTTPRRSPRATATASSTCSTSCATTA